MTERQITHFVGDECEPNGHRPDTLIERLHAQPVPYSEQHEEHLRRGLVRTACDPDCLDYGARDLAHEAAAALERAERVVEVLREVAAVRTGNSTSWCEVHGSRCDADQEECVPTGRILSYGIKPELMERTRAAVAAYDTTRADTVRAGRPSQADETPNQHKAKQEGQ